PMTDAFAADVLMLALAAVVAERPLLAGAAFAWTALVRPSTLVLGAVVLGWLALRQRTVRWVLAAMVFAFMVGWQVTNCWRLYNQPCLVTPSYSADTLGWGLNLGRTNVRVYFSQHMPGELVVLADPWLEANAANAPLWMGERIVWFAQHPHVLAVTI